jgi:hypothetical protein
MASGGSKHWNKRSARSGPTTPFGTARPANSRKLWTVLWEITASTLGALWLYNSYATDEFSSRPGLDLNLGLGRLFTFRNLAPRPAPIRVTSIRAPSDMIAGADRIASVPVLGVSTNLIRPYPSDWRTPWHEAGENVVFCDGHVASVKRARLYSPTESARRRWKQ